jgi:hypothetical protein
MSATALTLVIVLTAPLLTILNLQAKLQFTSRNPIQDLQQTYLFSTCFVLIHYIFRHYYWVTLVWYSNQNIS